MVHRNCGDVAVLPVERRAVEMSVLAEPLALSVVRVVAADLATRADFDLDDVADLQIAVEEACAALLDLAVPASMLFCAMSLGPRGMTVEVTADTVSNSTLGTDSFGWRVLTTLADSVDVSRHGRHPRPNLTIRLRKNRETGTVLSR